MAPFGYITLEIQQSGSKFIIDCMFQFTPISEVSLEQTLCECNRLEF